MSSTAKSLMILALGGMAVYFVLKAREAQAALPKKPALPVAVPEPSKPDWEISQDGIVIRVDGEITVPINIFGFLTPQKRIELEAKQYYNKSVYA